MREFARLPGKAIIRLPGKGKIPDYANVGLPAQCPLSKENRMAHFKITGIGKQPEVRVLMGKPLAAVLVVGATHEGVDLRRVVDVAATRSEERRVGKGGRSRW